MGRRKRWMTPTKTNYVEMAFWLAREGFRVAFEISMSQQITTLDQKKELAEKLAQEGLSEYGSILASFLSDEERQAVSEYLIAKFHINNVETPTTLAN